MMTTLPCLPVAWLPAKPPLAIVIETLNVCDLLGPGAFTALTLSAAPSGAGELVVFNLSYETGTATFVASAGVPGRIYTLCLLGKTDCGEVRQALVGMICTSSGISTPLPTAPNPGFGDPAMWPCGSNPVLSPVVNLPSYTVAATGTTALTAAVVPVLAITLINAGSGGGVLIGVQAATWSGYRPVFQNRSGGVITLYPYAGDQFEGQSVSAGITMQNFQTVTLSVAQSGAIIVS